LAPHRASPRPLRRRKPPSPRHSQTYDARAAGSRLSRQSHSKRRTPTTDGKGAWLGGRSASHPTNRSAPSAFWPWPTCDVKKRGAVHPRSCPLWCVSSVFSFDHLVADRLSNGNLLLLRRPDLTKQSIKLAQDVASCPLLNSSANARTKGEPLTRSRIKNAVSHPVLPP
jgi:hypothetical protein